MNVKWTTAHAVDFDVCDDLDVASGVVLNRPNLDGLIVSGRTHERLRLWTGLSPARGRRVGLVASHDDCDRRLAVLAPFEDDSLDLQSTFYVLYKSVLHLHLSMC